MAWTADLIDIKSRNGLFVLAIAYTDGDARVIQETTLTQISDDIIRQIARNRVSDFERASVSKSELSKMILGPIDLTPPPPPPPPPPTAFQVSLAAFLPKWRLYQAYLRIIEGGLLPADDPATIALKTDLIKDFDPAFIPLLPIGQF